jgi:hypothetical protein
MHLYTRNEAAAPIRGEITHDEDTFANELQKTALTPPYTSPNPTIAPTIQCVVETGQPKKEATYLIRNRIRF